MRLSHERAGIDSSCPNPPIPPSSHLTRVWFACGSHVVWLRCVCVAWVARVLELVACALPLQSRASRAWPHPLAASTLPSRRAPHLRRFCGESLRWPGHAGRAKLAHRAHGGGLTWADVGRGQGVDGADGPGARARAADPPPPPTHTQHTHTHTLSLVARNPTTHHALARCVRVLSPGRRSTAPPERHEGTELAAAKNTRYGLLQTPALSSPLAGRKRIAKLVCGVRADGRLRGAGV